MTLMEVTPTVLSVQKIFLSVVFCSQAQALKVALVMDLDTLKASLLQRKVEVCRAADILVAVQRVISVGLIKRRGAFLAGIVHLALVGKEVAKPVVLVTIFINGVLHTGRNRNLVAQLDDLLGTFDDPSQNAFTGIVKQVLAVILDVALAGNLCVERDNDKATPDTIIGSGDTRQVVGIQHQRVARLEGERVLILFSANTSSVEQSCLTVESFRREPSCISAAMSRRLPLTSAISGLMFLRQPTVSVSAEMLPL